MELILSKSTMGDDIVRLVLNQDIVENGFIIIERFDNGR